MGKDVHGRGIVLPEIKVGEGLFRLQFNPYVTTYAVVLIWTFIIYSLSERALAFKEFQLWFRWARRRRPDAPGGLIGRARPRPRGFGRTRAAARARSRVLSSEF